MAHTRIVKGISVAPGLALGPVHVVLAARSSIPAWSVAEEDVESEIARLRAALETHSHELRRRRGIVLAHASEREAAIFDVHRMLLQEPQSVRRVEAMIREQRVNAEAAVHALIEHLEASLSSLDGSGTRGIAGDFADPWRGVLDALQTHEREHMERTGEQVVLAAAELTPQVVTFLERERVLAVITETGGRFSHGAVLARSFNVPCVVGLSNLLSRLEQGMPVCVDGDGGTVQLRPDREDVDAFLGRVERRSARQKKLALHAALEPRTPDGRRLSLQVNIESLRDLDTFQREHVDGVGLLRTEFLYMERAQFPSEEEQYRLYRRVLERMQGRPVTLRTLDIGNDKQLPYFKTPKEANPALGWRGLRISLEWQDLLRVQLRAALRASAHGDLRVLLPMVTAIEEVSVVRRIFDDVRRQLTEQGFEVPAHVPLGVMIEVPSAVLVLSHLVKEIDFVSVGTNDLVQYLLAVDRDNAFVSRLYDVHHPAVIRALAEIARVANAAKKPCAVCGEMAGDYATALMLLGLGFDSVSVVPSLLPEIKFAVRETTYLEALEIARLATEQSTSEGVRRVLQAARDRLHARQISETNEPDAVGGPSDGSTKDGSKNRESA